MDQRSVCWFLRRKGMTATDIHKELVDVLHSEAVSYQTVTKYLRSESFIKQEAPSPNSDKKTCDEVVNEAILAVLEEEPYSSVRQIAQRTKIPKSTVYYHLVHSLGFVAKHARWIPKKLTQEQLNDRVCKCDALSKLLRKVFHHNYKFIITLDQSWFYLNTDYERQWLPPDADRPEKERVMISSKKIMVTIVWNTSGMLLIDMLPKGVKYNSDYYINHILRPLVEILDNDPDHSREKFVIHADNAKPHTSKKTVEFFEENKIKKAIHPSYSPDVAPTDFFQLGYIKGRLQGMKFEEPDELFSTIIEIANSIPPDILHQAYREWLTRLDQVCAKNGAYY